MRTLDSTIVSRLTDARHAPCPAQCPIHHLPMLATQSGLQQVCPYLDCDEHVWADGPRKRDPMKETTSTITLKSETTIAPALAKQVTLPAKVDKASRAKLVEEAAAAKKAAKVDPPKPAPKAKKEKAEKPAKPAKDPNALSVSDIAREEGVDPKRARARLRAAGLGAVEGRWPTVERGTPTHAEWVAIINPSEEEPEADEEEEDEEEE